VHYFLHLNFSMYSRIKSFGLPILRTVKCFEKIITSKTKFENSRIPNIRKLPNGYLMLKV
jgi:hypothetical protein